MTMTLSEHKTQALQNLNDPSQDIYVREEAIQRLADHPTEAEITRIVEALDDDQFGVRWEAAVQLANLGDAAVPPLLRVLVNQHESTWLREGAHHVLYYSSSLRVREETQSLQKALRGPAAEVATAATAVKLLQSWH